VSGYDLYLTLDSKVQALAESLFVNKRGGAVAIDPRTGGLIALVSKPDYDPRIFSKKISPETWKYLTESPDKPMFNRATQSGVMPGSTWKPFMALMALEEGLITENTVITCTGGYRLGGRLFRDHAGHAHGPITVKQAIQHSCNTFFFTLMMRTDVNTFHHWATAFGFGKSEAADLTEQSSGLIPDSAYYNRAYPRGWTSGYSINLGIGQGDMLVTPLQLARYIASIANRGTLVTPHLVHELRHPETGETMVPERDPARTVPVHPDHFEVVKQGMRLVMEKGTGVSAQVPGISSGGKTGTAQNPHGKDHSVFVLFAPLDDPQIAIAVLVENGGFGATQAAPIASLMAEQYLTGQIIPQRIPMITRTMSLASEELIQAENE
jgi:penicillin-binding protein 2